MAPGKLFKLFVLRFFPVEIIGIISFPIELSTAVWCLEAVTAAVVVAVVEFV